MKQLSFGGVLLCLAAVLAPSAHAQSKPRESDPVITIDGAKNPELIPDWAAWLEAFRFMSLPAEPEIPIPTPVYLAATPEQRALIRKEALYVTAHVNGIYDRALKLQTGLTAENLPQRTEEVEAMEMERRQTALDVRDRLLEALPLVVQNALREFVETVIRKGYTIQILKSKLAQFQLPK